MIQLAKILNSSILMNNCSLTHSGLQSMILMWGKLLAIISNSSSKMIQGKRKEIKSMCLSSWINSLYMNKCLITIWICLTISTASSSGKILMRILCLHRYKKLIKLMFKEDRNKELKMVKLTNKIQQSSYRLTKTKYHKYLVTLKS